MHKSQRIQRASSIQIKRHKCLFDERNARTHESTIKQASRDKKKPTETTSNQQTIE